MEASLVFSLNQAAVNAIRAAGATSQLILVEGTSYTGAWSTYHPLLLKKGNYLLFD
jgi:endoglucanase